MWRIWDSKGAVPVKETLIKRPGMTDTFSQFA